MPVIDVAICAEFPRNPALMMGTDVRGYARASQQYFGTGLGELSFDQVVKLLAIAHAANGYFKHPERFEAIVRRRLSRLRQ